MLNRKEKIYELRNQGMSIGEIAKILNTSKSAIQYWTKNIVLSPQQKDGIHRRTHENSAKIIGQKSTQRHQQKRLQWQEEGRLAAKQNNADHKAMCMLYWAEGSKKRNHCVMANSDVHLLKLFLNYVITFFPVKKEDFTMRIHMHIDNGLSIAKIEQYWLTELKIGQTQLRKHFVDTRIVKNRKRKNTLHYGVCTLSINRTDIVQHIYGAIQEYGQFTNPDWLNK